MRRFAAAAPPPFDYPDKGASRRAGVIDQSSWLGSYRRGMRAGATRVYASLPLAGPAGWAGRDILRGADLALERYGTEGVEIVAFETHAADRDARARENARRAAEDPDALAYLGDFHSSQVMATAPILSAAGLLQVAPAATFVGLGGPTLVRLMPSDAGLAGAIVGRAIYEGRFGVDEAIAAVR
jgi:ABC-type branched-subunit amino acid transport system substrate-binding protein